MANQRNRNNGDDWWKWVLGLSLGPLALSNLILIIVIVAVFGYGLIALILHDLFWDDWGTWVTILGAVVVIAWHERNKKRRPRPQRTEAGEAQSAMGGGLILVGFFFCLVMWGGAFTFPDVLWGIGMVAMLIVGIRHPD